MDNASKALIMAGAVMLSVMLISVTMWLFGNFKDYNMRVAIQEKQVETEAFNRFFVYSQPHDNLITGADMINILAKARDCKKVYRDVEHDITAEVNVSFKAGSVPNINTVTDADWNTYIDKVIDSNDSLLDSNKIKYTFERDNTGRVYKIKFTK